MRLGVQREVTAKMQCINFDWILSSKKIYKRHFHLNMDCRLDNITHVYFLRCDGVVVM